MSCHLRFHGMSPTGGAESREGSLDTQGSGHPCVGLTAGKITASNIPALLKCVVAV